MTASPSRREILALVLSSAGTIAVAAPPRASSPIPRELDAVRTRHQLKPFRADPMLQRAANRQVTAMAAKGVLSHEVDGTFARRMEQAGIGYGRSGENLGMGYRSLQEAIQGWLASPPHRATLLAPWATRAGLARAPAADGTLFWALIVASDDEKPGPLPGDPGPVVPRPRR